MTSNHTSNNTVFFDLGNVLVFFNLDKMYSQLAKCTKIPKKYFFENHWQREKILLKYETGLLSSLDLYHYLQSQTSHPFSIDEMKCALADIFIPNLELWPIVEKLKNQGSKLVLISNTNECHFQHIYSKYSILKLFDSLILSYEVGACKPDVLIFQKALREAQGKTFYTDDIPEFVAAGRKAGLDAEIFIDVPSLEKTLKDRKFLID